MRRLGTRRSFDLIVAGSRDGSRSDRFCFEANIARREFVDILAIALVANE
jgi:hypothetical protein